MKPAAYVMLALIGMGLIGMHNHVDGAGWCLALGIFGIAFGDVFA
jgi:hypothetical protein